MDLKVTSNLKALRERLEAAQKTIPQAGVLWAQDSATAMFNNCREHLQGQGREGGAPPPLSGLTRHIYGTTGEPDGSGIHDHLVLTFQKDGDVYLASVGVEEGRSTMIAKVQNDGAIIPVTEKMRGFLSAVYGIHLKQTTTHIEIPGRHFWDESWQKTKAESLRGLRKILQI